MCFAPQRRALFRHFFDIRTSKSGPRPSVFNTFDFKMCFAPQRRALFRHLNFQKCSENGVFCTFSLRNVLRATTACTFFDISTSKSRPTLRCFVHFDFKMCFAPQRRALFRHLNFQKWSDTEVFCTFWLQNVLRATTACNFSSLLWPAGSAPAALASLLFDPPEPQIIGKTQCFATFLPFRASVSSVLLLFLFSSDLLSSNLPLLSASALLCFSSVHIVGSLTSKLPSIMIYLCISTIFITPISSPKQYSHDNVIPLHSHGIPMTFPWYLQDKVKPTSFVCWFTNPLSSLLYPPQTQTWTKVCASTYPT